ncbi:glycosyltransferase, family 1 [Arcobacter acticola]|uniref:Glycosyltransferase, family 1 n=1 Tax=Arcobacter acticola TaxID=1849015 RepID=A0A6M8EUH8_9BACT|nr:glycosyltransferase family 4 protein [Arcobacter acticola]QKE28147.1 glycosyltransferase, family 1 [Arcobacter acticola]
MKKVISIVLNNFKNDSRVLKENISLQKAGYEVQVVALHEEPLKEFEEVQNILVHRVKLKSRGWSKHKLVQLLKYFEFIYRVVKQYKNSDIIHCNDLNSLPIGVIIKKFFNRDVKIVYDAHEYETELNGLKGIQKKLVKWLEKKLIKYSDKVITVSDAIADEYVKLYDIKKPALVLNTPPYKEIQKKNIFRETSGIGENQTIFLYQGGLSKGRGIEILLEAFKSINNENIVIVFLGYGPLESMIQEVSKEYNNIYFHKAVSPDILLDYTNSADFGISTIEDTCLSYRYCLPNKMFEYLMAELPVIVSNLYEMKRLVELNNIGTVAKENTPDGLKKAIEEAVKLDKEELKINIQQLKTIYNWEEQEKVLLDVYRNLYAN